MTYRRSIAARLRLLVLVSTLLCLFFSFGEHRAHMKHLVSTALFVMLVTSTGLPAQQAAKPLDIYVVDVEGGKAILYVSPTGQTALIDSGYAQSRDTDRILAVMDDAGVKQIDYAIATHYHTDHVGGLEALSKRVPINHFVDHGPTVEVAREQVGGFQAMYAELSKGKRIVVAAGDRLPITGIDWRIVTSAGGVLTKPLPGGGGPNPACAAYTRPTEDAAKTEDDQSVGSVVTLGQFRSIDLGDLLWDRAVQVMCPRNMVGDVDVYFMSGHGTDITSASPLTDGLHARAAVMQNGPRKGGQVGAIRTIRQAPRLEDLWQLHWSYAGGLEYNSPGLFIANVDDAATVAGVLVPPPPPVPPAAPAGAGGRGPAAPPHVPAYWIKISAYPNGSFTITNSRNKFSKTYN